MNWATCRSPLRRRAAVPPDQQALRAHQPRHHHQLGLLRMGSGVRRRQDDHRAAGSHHPPLPHPGDRQRLLAAAQQHRRQQDQSQNQGKGGHHPDHQLIPSAPYTGWVKVQRAAWVSLVRANRRWQRGAAEVAGAPLGDAPSNGNTGSNQRQAGKDVSRRGIHGEGLHSVRDQAVQSGDEAVALRSRSIRRMRVSSTWARALSTALRSPWRIGSCSMQAPLGSVPVASRRSAGGRSGCSTLEFGGAVVQLLQMPPRHVFAFGVQTFQLVPFCLDHGHLASILLPRQIECHLK